MPEMIFRVRWPDTNETSHYSPSLVIEEFLETGRTYELADFVDRTRTALDIASDRVRAKFGMPCPRALAQRHEIERRAARFESGGVTIVSFGRPVQAAAQ